MSGTSRKSSLFKHFKRHRRSDTAETEDDSGIELSDMVAAQQEELGALHTPINSAVAHIFDMQKPGDNERLAADI